MKTNTILNGDALTHLKELKSESVNCVMTSPPYWALRDYDVLGELGLEKTSKEYIRKLSDIFDQVKRVLRKDGTCWVNMGDTYYGGGFGQDTDLTKTKQGTNRGTAKEEDRKILREIRKNTKEFPVKSLTMIPFRLAIEMVSRGWILRNVIIWQKPNVMPHSVNDRFTVDFEYVFLFAKNKKYWFKKQLTQTQEVSLKRYKSGFSDASSFDWKQRKINQEYRNKIRGRGMKEGFSYGINNPEGANMRTVWKIPTRHRKGAHFAVYPEELCEIPISAGCPEGGIVLDPFFGSGTTGIVALKQNKQFIGIELNPEYIEIAKKRLKPYLEQTKLEDFKSQEH